MALEHQIVRFLFELGHLRSLRRSRYLLAGVTAPPTIAAHSLWSGFIAYFLANAEEEDPAIPALMCFFHEIEETRLGDQLVMTQRYTKPEAELDVVHAQLDPIAELSGNLLELKKEFRMGKTKRAMIAHDATILENALQAQEYKAAGFQAAQYWLESVRNGVKTDTAKRWIELIAKTDPNEWWQQLQQKQ